MAKYCNVCRQTYSVEYPACPFCDAPALRDRSQPVSAADPTPVPDRGGLTGLPVSRPLHREMATPVAAGQIESRAEFSDHRENGGPLGPNSSAKMLLGQPGPQANRGGEPHQKETPNDQSGADIDLGGPVFGGRGSESGPPSGASFVSWSSLVSERKNFDDEGPAKPAAGQSARAMLGNAVEAAKSATKLSAGALPRTSIWYYVAAVAIGLLLAVVVQLIR